MGHPTPKGWTLAIAILLLGLSAPGGEAQSSSRGITLPELRAEVSRGDVSSAHLAAGVHVRSGTYFRLALLGGVGTAWKDGERGTGGRVELHGRFHLDPFREARLGAYGIGGIAAIHDPFSDWQARLVVGAGVELPSLGRTATAIEAALAGGFRISIVARRLSPDRR